jgi:hypothetical protein
MGTGSYFSGIKRPGREADHSIPSIAEIKNGGAITPLPHTGHGLVIKLRDNFTFYGNTKEIYFVCRKLKQKLSQLVC